MTKSARLLAAGLPVWLAACVGTETGNPSFEGELAYDAYSSEASVAALRQGQAGAVVEQAWLVLGDVELLDAARCDDLQGDGPTAGSPHADGLGAGDHAMQGAARTPFSAETGDYCGVTLSFLRAAESELPQGAPEALSGHSILLTGTLPERDDLPFVVASAYDEQLVLVAAGDDDSFPLGPDQARLLLAFDVAHWLSELPLDTLEPGDDGVVRIDGDNHAELLAQFDAAVASGVELRADPDATGLADEATERLARARD